MFARPAPPLGRRRLLLLLLPLSLAGLLLLPQRLASPSSTPDRWHRALSVLERAVSARVFPGAVALVADAERGVLLRAAVGNMTYDHDPTPLGQPGQT